MQAAAETNGAAAASAAAASPAAASPAGGSPGIDKLRKLEARLVKGGSMDGSPGVSVVGFARRPAARARVAAEEGGASNSSRSSRASSSSAVSRTVHGIERVAASLPGSPAIQQQQQHQHQRRVQPEQPDLPPPSSSSPQQAATPLQVSRGGGRALKRRRLSKFSRSQDAAIMNAMFFERRPGCVAELAQRMGCDAQEVKARYNQLMNEAARADSLEMDRSVAYEMLSRTHSISRAVVSLGSQHEDSRGATAAAASAAAGGGEMISSSSNPASSSTPSRQRRVTTSSPSINNASLKNALKNQPQIKQFFVPRSERSRGHDEQEQSEQQQQQQQPEQPGQQLEQQQPAADGGSMPRSPERKGLLLKTPVRSGGGGSSNHSRGTSGRRGASSSSSTLPVAVQSVGQQRGRKGSGVKSVQRSLSAGLLAASVREGEAAVGSATEGAARSELVAELEEKERTISELRKALVASEDELVRSKQLAEMMSVETKELRERCVKAQEAQEEHKNKVAKVLEEMLRATDVELHRHERRRITEEGFRLGRIIVQKHGVGPRAKLTEMWEEGEAFRAMRLKQGDLLQRREELEKRRKATQRAVRQRKAGSELSELGDMEADEAVRAELSNVKRREQELVDQRAALEVEKIMFVKALRRLRAEDGSRFNRQPVLNNRYLLRELLGKGGFSEVWKGFDLIELRDVAVKVHELNASWSEHRKASYLKHATREYKIHLSLVHPRIVQLFDVFEIDSNAFATVLEHCEGTDLELHLKWRKQLPEREARSVLLQILSGLRYLSAGGDMSPSEASPGPGGADKSRRPCIIHYDLKPANILFDAEGGVKITDFGLSKIMEPQDSESTGIELTSQGAGTYWYLPPECFRLGGAPPKISSKVDVWSVGVIFFQMLYGSRPFGEGLTQERLLHDQTMLKATQVTFPAKPQISAEAKNFIRRCLTYNQELRPDVKTICLDPYLRQKKL